MLYPIAARIVTDSNAPLPVPPPDTSWPAYLKRFHAERPGITERILTRCRAEGVDPYQWCAQPLDGQGGPVLDVACGSAPMADHLTGWMGSDTSSAELHAAQALHRGPVVLASAAGLPIPTGALAAAVCSMAMQIIEPVSEAFSELARILRPDGRAVLLVPATGPLPWRQAVTYLRLQIALRQRIRYPNDDAITRARLEATATRVGLRVLSDERCGFSLPLENDTQVDELLQSLYLPGIEPGRLHDARRALSHRIGDELTVPLRRVVLERTRPT